MTSQNKLRHEETSGNWCDVLINPSSTKRWEIF